MATPRVLVVASALAAAGAVGVGLACGRIPVRPDGGRGLLPVGASAPDVEAYDASDRSVRLSDLRGRPVVVYFYPKDGTPGCTQEACAFRDAYDRYQAAGIAILGVSRDDRGRHRRFMADHALPFPLAPDPHGSVERAYGVSSFLGMSSRVTFLVDREGKIARVWPDVVPGTHANEVLAAAHAAVSPAAPARAGAP
jgi:peroxiredoxin Q/BCP